METSSDGEANQVDGDSDAVEVPMSSVPQDELRRGMEAEFPANSLHASEAVVSLEGVTRVSDALDQLEDIDQELLSARFGFSRPELEGDIKQLADAFGLTAAEVRRRLLTAWRATNPAPPPISLLLKIPRCCTSHSFLLPRSPRNVFSNLKASSESAFGNREEVLSIANITCDALLMPDANESGVAVEVSGLWVQLPDCDKPLGLVVVVGRHGSRCGCDEQRRRALLDHADDAFSDAASTLPGLMLDSPPVWGVSREVVRAPNRVRDRPSHFTTPAAFC
mgnify:FL=1